MKNKLLTRFLSCIALMAIITVAGLPTDIKAATSTKELTPTWKWVGTGEKPILCDAETDDFNISWPSKVNAAELKASDVTITLKGQFGDSLTLTADKDYTITTTAKKTTIDLNFQYYAYTPVYTTMTISIDDTDLTIAAGYDVNLTKTYDIASVYVYENQMGGGLDKEGTVVTHGYYGFENLTSWEQILTKPTYTDSIVIDGTKQYVAKDENGKGYLTTDSSKAYTYDATAYVKPELVGNTVYITERYNQTEQKEINGTTYTFSMEFRFASGMSLSPSQCDQNLKAAPGFVIGTNWFEHMRWPWQNGQDNGQWTDPSTVLSFNQQFLRDPGYQNNYSVSYGTSIDDVIANILPTTATPAINHGTKVKVNISWSSTNYNPYISGDYTFTGTVDLNSIPEGYTYDGATISTTVTVKANN